ncbi:MAG: thioester reductase domain-containing protein [Pseudomonadota bacterium]
MANANVNVDLAVHALRDVSCVETACPQPTLYRDVRPLGKSRHVFVTGATGLVGGALLREIIERSDAKVTCLVRGTTFGPTATDRLAAKCAEEGIGRARFDARVRVVTGALDKKRFGLSDNEWSRLTDEADTIFHLAAKLNYLAPLSALENTNVGGTNRILELATTGARKDVHFMSSSGVYMSLDAPEFGYLERSVPVERYDRHVIGYLHSKWHSELAVRRAREAGVPALIYRPSFIGGTLSSGFLPDRDVTAQFMTACLQMGAVPEVPFVIDIVPVDVLAAAVANIACRDGHALTDINLCNPRPSRIADLAEMFPEFNGQTLTCVPYDTWCAKLRERPMTSAKNLMIWATRPTKDAPLGLLRAFTAVKQAKAHHIDMDYALAGSGVTCPAVDRTMVAAYASRLI